MITVKVVVGVVATIAEGIEEGVTAEAVERSEFGPKLCEAAAVALFVASELSSEKEARAGVGVTSRAVGAAGKLMSQGVGVEAATRDTVVIATAVEAGVTVGVSVGRRVSMTIRLGVDQEAGLKKAQASVNSARITHGIEKDNRRAAGWDDFGRLSTTRLNCLGTL
jgi:hypothetical protein